MLRILISTLAGAVSLYSTLCFIRIILTWFPPLNFSSIGRILSSLCDPYLNLFSKFPLRIGMMDFTAMLALGVLYVLSSILNNVAATGYISISRFLGTLIQMLWSIFSSIGMVIFLVFFVRYLVAVFSKTSNQYNSPWQRFDDVIRVFVFKICRFFSGDRNISYKTALLIDSIAIFLLLVVTFFVLNILLNLVNLIPF